MANNEDNSMQELLNKWSKDQSQPSTSGTTTKRAGDSSKGKATSTNASSDEQP